MKTLCSGSAASLAAVLCMVASLSAALPAHNRSRTTRGFKNAALSTARGFGKRAGLQEHRDMLDTGDPSQIFATILRERSDTDSFPADWFTEELTGNPDLARTVMKRLTDELVAGNSDLARAITQKIIDLNQDGDLSPDELLRSSY